MNFDARNEQMNKPEGRPIHRMGETTFMNNRNNYIVDNFTFCDCMLFLVSCQLPESVSRVDVFTVTFHAHLSNVSKTKPKISQMPIM